MINKEKTTILAIVSALPIFIITSIRYDVGSDYFSYRSIYALMQYGDSGRYEWLFYLMNRFVGLFDVDPQWIFVVSAAIFLYFSFKRLWADSPNPCLSIFLLMGSMIYFTYINGMRQLLGCSICFYAIEYAYKRKPLSVLYAFYYAYSHKHEYEKNISLWRALHKMLNGIIDNKIKKQTSSKKLCIINTV